jgi:hypothetical protein
MKACRVLCILAGLLILSSGIMHRTLADELAALTGRVTDSQGLVVPNVKIQATNVNTNITYSGETNGDGLYRISEIAPGLYRVLVQKTGFVQILKPDVQLHVQDDITLNFSMRIGSVSETVTVQSGAPLIDTQSGSVSTVIDRKFVAELPLNGRSFNTLLELTPGVVLAPATNESPGQFSVNGQRTNANYFNVDGVSVNFGVSAGMTGQQGGGGIPAFSAFGGTSSLVSVDAVQEFRVQTSSFAPEYGRTPGGQVSIETRSGTNAFHGGVFDYFRNDKLDANNWFNNAVPLSHGGPLPRAEERQNDFGGFLGGPINRSKTFFFFSYEGLRLHQPQTEVRRVPSEYARTTAVAAAVPYLDAYPQPDDRTITPGVYLAPFTASFSNQVTMNATSLRVDHSFNSKWLLFARYNDAPSKTLTRPASPSNIYSTTIPTKTTTVGLTTLLTPDLTNSIRGNYSVQRADLSFSLDSIGGAVPPDPTALLPPPLSSRNSSGFFQSQAGFYFVGSDPEASETQINLVDDIAFNIGHHQIKFGADWRRLDYSIGSSPAVLSYFSSVQGLATNGTLDFLFASNIVAAKMLFHNFSFYGQDTWQVQRRLTLTYGLRWELDPAPSGTDGTKLASWQSVDNPNSLSLAPFGTPIWKATYGNLAPRLGAAYRLTDSGDFVLRGGWGLFYDLGTGTVGVLANAFPNVSSNFVSGPIQLPITSAILNIPGISLDPASSTSLFGFSPNLRLPRSYQWNVALEKSFQSKQAISVTYVGQAGRELLRREDLFPPSSNPTFSPGTEFVLTQNGDSSDYNALQVQYRKSLSRGLQALLNYTWSHSIDTGSDDSFDVNSHLVIPGAGDRGSSGFDVRHNFSGAVAYDLPHFSKERVLSAITRNWSVDTVMEARTGFPFDVETSSVAVPGITHSTRADLVPGQPIWVSGPYPGGKQLNFSAFAIPAQPRQGTLGRSAITGFGLTQVDLSVGRKFNFTERVNLQFRSDFFNVLNHPNFANPVPCLDCGPSAFGGASTQMLNGGLTSASGLGLSSVYQIGGPRSVQLSMKIQF